MTVVTGRVALNIIYEALLLMLLLSGGNDGKVASFKRNIPKNSSLECKNHTLFMKKMAKIDTLFMIKTAAHTYIAHIKEYPRAFFTY